MNADGHTLDVWVQWPDGEVLRPVVTVIADLYSNAILAYRVDKSESAAAVRLAFYDLFRDWGIPDFALLDNGRAFASKQMTGGQKTRFRFKVSPDETDGVLTALGVKVHWATPYSGQSKPIERSFRDLCDRVAKHPRLAGAYSGNSPMAKPDYARGVQPVDFDIFLPTLDEGSSTTMPVQADGAKWPGVGPLARPSRKATPSARSASLRRSSYGWPCLRRRR